MSLYLSRLVLDPGSRQVRRDLGDVCQMHRTILKAFPSEAAPCAFRKQHAVLYRMEIERSMERPVVLVQSETPPDWSFLSGVPDYLLRPPEHKEVGELFNRIQAGQVFRFRLRANAAKKIDTKTGPDGQRRNGRRIPLRTSEDLMVWLSRKADQSGFSLVCSGERDAMPDVRIVPEVDARAIRGDAASPGRVITFGGVLFEGRLQVSDANVFRETLASGIGSGKAYGFGLLSIAPVRAEHRL